MTLTFTLFHFVSFSFTAKCQNGLPLPRRSQNMKWHSRESPSNTLKHNLSHENENKCEVYVCESINFLKVFSLFFHFFGIRVLMLMLRLSDLNKSAFLNYVERYVHVNRWIDSPLTFHSPVSLFSSTCSASTAAIIKILSSLKAFFNAVWWIELRKSNLFSMWKYHGVKFIERIFDEKS